MRRTKIVCTIGPASSSREVLDGLVGAGMDVARLNFSHGTREEHGRTLERIRGAAAEEGRPVAVLQDLGGPKLRVGAIEGGPVDLEPGSRFVLTLREVAGSSSEVRIDLPDLPREMRAGDRILLADGNLELSVEETTEEDVVTRVVVGGSLSGHKGIHLPNRSLGRPSLTDKDREDLAFGLRAGVDFVALSFVRAEADIHQARELMKELGREVPIVAKIEKHEALENIGAILAAVDALMVARGDLGVETPLEKVPLVQKRLIRMAHRAGKPVIVATQMLRSMTENPRPTRAEVTDVANAILDGTDAVMLSEETAVGTYPVDSVRMMDRIALDTEQELPYGLWEQRTGEYVGLSVPEAVAHASCTLTGDVGARAVVVLTSSGATARLVAKYRPERPIVGITPSLETFRRLALVWGVRPVLAEDEPGREEVAGFAAAEALKTGLVGEEDLVVITAGVPMGTPGGTNLIRVCRCG
ncbi:MAG: pyruvate kinase [bacterium]